MENEGDFTRNQWLNPGRVVWLFCLICRRTSRRRKREPPTSRNFQSGPASVAAPPAPFIPPAPPAPPDVAKPPSVQVLHGHSGAHSPSTQQLHGQTTPAQSWVQILVYIGIPDTSMTGPLRPPSSAVTWRRVERSVRVGQRVEATRGERGRIRSRSTAR